MRTPDHPGVSGIVVEGWSYCWHYALNLQERVTSFRRSQHRKRSLRLHSRLATNPAYGHLSEHWTHCTTCSTAGKNAEKTRKSPWHNKCPTTHRSHGNRPFVGIRCVEGAGSTGGCVCFIENMLERPLPNNNSLLWWRISFISISTTSRLVASKFT